MDTKTKLRETLDFLETQIVVNNDTSAAAENIVIAAEMVAHQARVLQLELRELGR